MSKKKQVIVDNTNVRFFDYKEYRKLPSALDAVQMTESFTVVTTKGEKLFGKAGDYLVVGRRGCRYPVDKDIFEELHVEIDPR